MGALTKNTKAVANYQQWAAADITAGDILDIEGSLGWRGANSVTIESIGGISVVRFNVSQRVYEHYKKWEWLGSCFGLHKPAPTLIDEIEIETPDITMTADSINTWTKDEICIRDIKVVTKSSGLRVTVA